MTPTTGQIFLSEFFGTAVLILFGAGVCAGVTMKRSKANSSGWIVITFGWGLAVFMGVYAAYATGGHLNPAVTVGKWIAGQDLAANVPATATNVTIYIIAQMLGAMVGAACAWLAYKKQFDDDLPAASKLGCFATAPEIRSYGWNCVTEAIATFVLVAWCLYAGKSPSELGPLAVAFVIVAIGLSLGGPTGYAINPARDLGPRLAYAILPIPGKKGADWGYAWVPVVGPMIGGAAAGLLIPHMAGLF
ncbi:MIP/aquaporin family protein [Actinomyces faecalis]|uniref:MIP/aquaporin family protein n=1 Tax=Actinomyces faecalis TaxID=2722820 RepID=UPI001557F3C2|nr:MIP/aquaporin family protein [Actinomyces faecalis]